MKKLRTYLNGLSKEARLAYCNSCRTTEGYLRKAISVGQKLGADLCIALERESGGEVLCESLRPDVDWAYIRAATGESSPIEKAAA
jgi:DNA-binding transcriptional regulator YdaS (Cro superfamily)